MIKTISKSTLYFLIYNNILSSVTAFQSPFDSRSSLELPYGRQLRAIISGKVPPADETLDDDLTWWQTLDRNNTIDCQCGEFSRIEDEAKLSRWTNEGVKFLNIYPWSVSLVSPGGEHTYAFCGGTLINDRFVLTSAVCVDGFQGDDLDVLIGTWPSAHFLPIKNKTESIFDSSSSSPISEEEEDEELGDALETKNLIRKKVHRVIVHPKYSPNVLDFNIALLRLKGPVPTYGAKNGVSPICLPPADDILYDNHVSSSLFWRFHNQEGYIIPEKRTELTSEVLSKSECKALSFNKDWEKMPDTMICAKIPIPQNVKNHPYHDSYDCPGDAGNGLFVTVNGKKVQIGIDSWTACYGRPKGVGVYTRVQEFLQWIQLHIQDDGRHCAS